MEVQGRVLNVVGGAAVVVDHRHPVAALEDLQRLDLLGPLLERLVAIRRTIDSFES